VKIHIWFSFVDGPWGGGNQFLLALREKLESLGCFAESVAEADAILVNSHHFGSISDFTKLMASIRRIGHPVSILHRVVGSIAVARGYSRGLLTDQLIATFNQLFADGTIFQSDWSRIVGHSIGISKDQAETVIVNAPDARWFYPMAQRLNKPSGKRLRIVATSWSANWRKGFDIYRYLDEALDHSRYEFIFVGNSPIQFQNSRLVPPLGSQELGDLLRTADIYLTATVDDACSNAVVEALHCGLPVVARNSGGHPELVGNCGSMFDSRDDVLEAIERVATSIGTFRTPALPDMDAVAAAYIEFACQVHANSLLMHKLSPTHLPKLWASVVSQRFWSGLTRRVADVLPLREARLHTVVAGFRTASWEPDTKVSWDEDVARSWVKGVLARLPLFLDSMRHPNNPSLYRYSQSGDRHPTSSLASSVCVAQIMAMSGNGSSQDRHALVEHILSFEQTDGSIADPWVERNSRLGRLTEMLILRSARNLENRQTVVAETRQSVAALWALGSAPTKPFADFPQDSVAIDEYIKSLDWSRPWDAASHISHLAFFIVQHAACFGIGEVSDAAKILSQIEKGYRQQDGTWYSTDAQISNHQKLNGAMKMLSALEVAGVCELDNAEGLIDICLSADSDGHACNHLNVISVLQRCASVSSYRHEEVRRYLLDRLRRSQAHYWPWQGGFSFFPDTANHSYYNARVTTGMAEPDVQGTMLILRGMVLICEALGWSEDFRVKRSMT
jgi:glycosyltransferase involved in cell wall biosynthesis